MKTVHHNTFLVMGVCSLSLMVSSCMSSSAYDQKINALSQTTRQIKTDIDDLRYQLNNYNVELDILEGKSSGYQSSLSKLYQQTQEEASNEQRMLKEQIFAIEKNVSVLNNNLDIVLKDMRQLQGHANTTGTAITQYKGTISNLEKEIDRQDRQLNEMKDSLKIMSTIIEKKSYGKGLTYKVRSGDSLERIAKINDTTIEALKKANDLKGDLIFAGQELNIPN